MRMIAGSEAVVEVDGRGLTDLNRDLQEVRTFPLLPTDTDVLLAREGTMHRAINACWQHECKDTYSAALAPSIPKALSEEHVSSTHKVRGVCFDIMRGQYMLDCFVQSWC